MKALAVLSACLILAVPAQAFVHAGGPGPHFPGGHPGHGQHHGHGGFGIGVGGDGFAVPEGAAPADAAPVVEPAAEPFPVPVPYCPHPPRPKSGPHIIYIGARPALHGPQVIYGRE